MRDDNTDIIEVKSLTHQPDHEKADILEATAKSYEMLYNGTGAKHYKDKMQACLDDARDYRSCGFVRSVGATV